MNASTHINIALIGVKHHGQTILNAIRLCDRYNLHSCYDVDETAAYQVAETNQCRARSSFDELLSDDAIDAVALVTPNHLHCEQALKAFEADKHVFVEKPLAVTVADSRRMMTAAYEAGNILQVGHNTRKRKVFREAKRIVDSGVLGKIVSCHAHFSYPAGLSSHVSQWKMEKELCPLLPMTQLGTHCIDTLQYLLTPITHAICIGRSRVMRDEKSNEVVDTTTAMVAFENGIIGTIHAHYIAPDTFEVQIFGSTGKICCSGDRIVLTDQSMGKWNEEIFQFDEGAELSFVAEMNEFADCILHRTQPEISGEVGLRNVAVIEAMNRSVASKKIEEV